MCLLLVTLESNLPRALVIRDGQIFIQQVPDQSLRQRHKRFPATTRVQIIGNAYKPELEAPNLDDPPFPRPTASNRLLAIS